MEPQTGNAAVTRMSRVEWNPRAGVVANAQRRLPRLAEEFFSQVGVALAGDPDAGQLHRVRLAAKHMRYTLELFRACYGPALEQRIESLRQLQQVLGEINDCSVARRLVLAGRPSPNRTKAERFLTERQRDKTAELRKRWAEGMGAAHEQRSWIRYLAQHAREPR